MYGEKRGEHGGKDQQSLSIQKEQSTGGLEALLAPEAKIHPGKQCK
jgi:hypothetical protein